MYKKILLIFLLVTFSFTASIQAAKEIEFWTINLSPQHDDYFNNKIEEFKEKHPAVEITWEDINFSSINQQLRYRIAAGEIPEVVNLSPQLMASLLAEDLLFPISSLEQNYRQHYYPLLWENGYYEGKYYAFPWYVSSKLMAFNQEIFKIAGIAPKNIPEDREEFYKLAEKITAETGVYAFMPQIKIHHEFIEAGIKLFENEDQQQKAAFNTAKAEKIIKRYQSLVQKNVIPKDSLTAGFNIALERYKKNDLAILFTASQFLTEIENESDYLRDVTALSVIPTAEKGVLNAALMNLVIPKNADHKELAAEFAHHITSAKSQAEFAERTSILSSAVDLLEKGENETEEIIIKKDADQPLNKAAQKILREQITRNQDLTLVHPQAGTLLKIMDQEFARAFAGKISAKEALNKMEQKWNQVLKEEKKND